LGIVGFSRAKSERVEIKHPITQVHNFADMAAIKSHPGDSKPTKQILLQLATQKHGILQSFAYPGRLRLLYDRDDS